MNLISIKIPCHQLLKINRFHSSTKPKKQTNLFGTIFVQSHLLKINRFHSSTKTKRSPFHSFNNGNQPPSFLLFEIGEWDTKTPNFSESSSLDASHEEVLIFGSAWEAGKFPHGPHPSTSTSTNLPRNLTVRPTLHHVQLFGNFWWQIHPQYVSYIFHIYCYIYILMIMYYSCKIYTYHVLHQPSTTELQHPKSSTFCYAPLTKKIYQSTSPPHFFAMQTPFRFFGGSWF